MMTMSPQQPAFPATRRSRAIARIRLSAVSFGAASAIVTSVGLIIGFGTAEIPKSAIVAGLLIIGLADNLTDSLSIHIYQESERLEQRAAFLATVGNFVTRLAVAGSFVGLVLALSPPMAALCSVAWGLMLLAILTWLVARARGASVRTELVKHVAVAALVIVASGMTGRVIDILTH